MFVVPVLTYNIGTCGLTLPAMATFDAFHRRQLRQVIGIKHPQRRETLHIWTYTSISLPLTMLAGERPRATLPTALDKGLHEIGRRLQNQRDLDWLRSHDRTKWKNIIQNVLIAAQAKLSPLLQGGSDANAIIRITHTYRWKQMPTRI